ncbi:MAG: hypothetical protein WD063_05795 [Pirellulales bacterium]
MKCTAYQTAYRHIESIIQERTSVSEGIASLLQLCNKLQPSPIWKKLSTLNFEGDCRQLAHWLKQLLIAEPPENEINGFWFGLFNPIVDGEPTAGLYLCGSTRFDPKREDPDWPCNPGYFPDGRYADSTVLDSIYKTAYEKKSDVSNFAEYVLCLGYVSLIAARWCRGAMQPMLLGNTPLRAVAVGFDSGDRLLIDVLRQQRRSAKRHR